MAFINGNEVLFSAQLTGIVNVDDAMSTTSENPVQNKVVNTAINNASPILFDGIPEVITIPCDASGAPKLATVSYVGHMKRGNTVLQLTVVNATAGEGAQVTATATNSTEGITLTLTPSATITNITDVVTLTATSTDLLSTGTKKINVQYVFDGASGGDYELIETITLAEPTASIVRNTEPDSTPYNFKKIKIITKCSQSTAVKSFFVYCNLPTQTMIMTPFAHSSYAFMEQTDVIVDGGRMYALYSTHTNAAVNAGAINRSLLWYGASAITWLKLEGVSGKTMDTGMLIEIWGVRA